MANTGSDVALNENGSVRVVFSCEDQFVTFQFFLGGEKVGDPQRLSRGEAAKIGKRAADFWRLFERRENLRPVSPAVRRRGKMIAPLQLI